LQNTGSVVNVNILRDYNNLIDAINTVIERTAIAGQAMWGIFDITEQSSMWISPSSITTNIPGFTMSVAEIQAVYIQAMSQIAMLYNNNITALMESQIVTNVESLKLYIYGDLYVNGQLWMENAVFTPYITTSEQHLQKGMNYWNGSGFAMIWAQVADYGLWNGVPNIQSSIPIDLSSGYNIDIKKIVRNGSEVQSVDLTLYAIQKHNTGGGDPGKPEPIPQVLDAATLIMIIILLIATDFLLLWWKFPQAWFFLVIALVLVAVGLFASGFIARLLL
jgi:hypothetical protein